MGSQIHLFIFDPELAPYVVPVKKDRIFGKAQQFGNLLVGAALFNQIGHPDFGGGQVVFAGGQMADERGYDVVQIRLEDIDKDLLIRI